MLRLGGVSDFDGRPICAVGGRRQIAACLGRRPGSLDERPDALADGRADNVWHRSRLLVVGRPEA
jgi:hypothetical protein